MIKTINIKNVLTSFIAVWLIFSTITSPPSVVGLTGEGEMLYSTYLGGSQEDSVRCMTIDSQGNVYVAGQTASTNYPILNGINNTYVGGSYDGFISKFSNNGQLLWSTYFGGSDTDVVRGIQIDSQGNIIITGYTLSTDFPLLSPLYSVVSGTEIFVTKFSPLGNVLWSTLIGGEGNEYPQGMAVDTSDNIIIAGYTQSSNYPTLNAFDNTFNGTEDVIVTSLNPDGTMLWSTYLGGSFSDVAVGLAVDSQNDLYITGSSYSTEFPLLNAYSRMQNSGEAFLSKFNSSGNLEWSTFFGGTGLDIGFDVTVDNYDNAIIVGTTQSADLYLRNPYFSKNSGATDSFIARFTSDGLLSMSTYLGGTGTDTPYSIKVDANNALIIVGATGSADFPVRDAYNLTLSSAPEDYLVIFSPQDELVMATYIGGAGSDNARRVNLDQSNDIWIAGYTTSSDFPIMDPYNATYGGGGVGDVTLTKFNHTVPVVAPTSSVILNRDTITLTVTEPGVNVTIIEPHLTTQECSLSDKCGSGDNGFVGMSPIQSLCLMTIILVPIIMIRRRKL